MLSGSLPRVELPIVPQMRPECLSLDQSFSSYGTPSMYTGDAQSHVRIRSYLKPSIRRPVRRDDPRLLPKIRSQDLQFYPKKIRGSLMPSSRDWTVSKSNHIRRFIRFADPVINAFSAISYDSSRNSLLPLYAGINPESFCIPRHLEPLDKYQKTLLMAYLTSPNPAPALVEEQSFGSRDPNAKYFWWDIRQIRPWNDFNTESIYAIAGLESLLSLNLPIIDLPTPPRTTLQPENESELSDIHKMFYATKLNAALALSLGSRHLVMRQAGKESPGPSFISNYHDDSSEMIFGRGLGRIVGFVKSFENWNSGMRVEGKPRKIEYLQGLSHLHHHMRDNGCRYGFIMTEIELVVVRNGCDNIPYFGFFEVQTIPLSNHGTETCDFEDHDSLMIPGQDVMFEERPRMTALVALWYLHMLARDDILPGQASWRSEIGSVVDGSRRKALRKDEWMPDPQLCERRDAKRSRGWIWPEDPMGMKELGNTGLTY